MAFLVNQPAGLERADRLGSMQEVGGADHKGFGNACLDQFLHTAVLLLDVKLPGECGSHVGRSLHHGGQSSPVLLPPGRGIAAM